MSDGGRVTTLEQLKAIYGEPARRSLVKEARHITEHYRRLIEAAPFLTLASVGPEGLDCSPRGDQPGLAVVLDEKTIALPDRLGNNRIDTLQNIVRDPRVGLLFLIPGVGETLRLNGRAEITIAPELLERFAVNGKRPRTVLIIHVEAVYFQCARAIQRSRLWDPAAQVDRKTLPTAGQITEALDSEVFDGAAYDAELPARQAKTLW